MKIIKIGSRGSKLAMKQSNLVKSAIEKKFPDIICEIIIIKTEGDRILDRPLLEFGGKGVFVSEIEEGIINNTFDIAVHSAKDMPNTVLKGLKIGGVLKREDPRDVLLSLKSNKKIKTIGTSSLRRKLQIEEILDNIETKHIRGNVDTRINKLRNGEYDGIILAVAGLKRLNLLEEEDLEYTYFDENSITPASGQGIIAIEMREDDELSFVIDEINDKKTFSELILERRILEIFNAGCHSAFAAFTRINNEDVEIIVMNEKNGSVIKKQDVIKLLDLDKYLEGVKNIG